MSDPSEPPSVQLKYATSSSSVIQEPPLEAPTTSDPPQEALTSADRPQELQRSSKPPQKIPISSESPQEILMSSEPLREIPITPEPSKEILPSSELPQEITNSSECPQDRRTSTDLPQEAQILSETPQERPTSSVPPKEVSTSSKPLEETLTPSELPHESTISSEHSQDILTSSVPVQEVLTTSISPASDEVPYASVTGLESEVKPHTGLMPLEISSSAENAASARSTDTNTLLETEILIHDSTDVQTPSETQLETVPVLPSQTSSVPTLHEITSAVQPSAVNLDSLSMQSVIPSPAVLNPEVERTPAVTGHVCVDEPSDPHTLQELHRSMINYRSSLEEERPSRNIVTTRGPDLIDGVLKSKMKQNAGPSMAVEDPISDQSIFSEATEYEEEFILTENMVNSYTFSEESKSTDYSNSDSPMESGKSIANEDIIAAVEKAGLPVEPTDMDEKSDHVVNIDVTEKAALSDEKAVTEEKQKHILQDGTTDTVQKSADQPPKLDETLDNVVNNGDSDVKTKADSEECRSIVEKSENITCIGDVLNAMEIPPNIDKKPDNVAPNVKVNIKDKTILTDKPASVSEKSSVDVEEVKRKEAITVLEAELFVTDGEKEDLLKDHEAMNEDDLLNISDEVVEESDISEKSLGALVPIKVSDDKINDKQGEITAFEPQNESEVSEPMDITEKENEQQVNVMEEEDMELDEPIQISNIIEDRISINFEDEEIEQVNTEKQIEIDESVKIPNLKDDKKPEKCSEDVDSKGKSKKGGMNTVEVKLDEVSEVETTDEIEKNTSAKRSETEKTKTVVTPNEETNVAGPSPVEKGSGDSSDGMLALEDTLGLFTEGRAMLREDEDSEEEEEEEDDDDNNEDDESNPMAPDSSEVESNAPVNEETEVDQSEDDPEQTNQSEAVVAPPEDDIDQSLQSIALAVMDFCDDEDEFGYTIASVAGSAEKKTTDATTIAEKAKESPKESVEPETAVPEKDATEKTVEPTDIDTPVDAGLQPAEQANKAEEVQHEAAKVTEAVAEKPHKEPPPTLKGPTVEPTPVKRPATPNKPKKLEIAKPGNVMSIVELESSSDSDVQESYKAVAVAPAKPPSPPTPPSDEVSETTSVNLPKDIDIMSTSCGDTSNIISNKAENVISGLPAPSPVKKTAARINTSEITIKTTGKPAEQPTITIPDEVEEKKEERREKKDRKAKKDKKTKPTFSLEVFNIDSDEEDKKSDLPKTLSAIELQKALDNKKCVNYVCSSDREVEYVPAPSFVLSYYEVKRSRRCTPLVCMPCLHRVSQRTVGLMEGIRSKQPLISLDMEKQCEELVEISDSESDSDGEDAPDEHDEILTADTVQMLEEELATMLNETWQRCGMAEQLASCEKELMKQLEEVQKGFDEVNGLLATEQTTMDRIRNELYATFASEVRELEPIDIDDGAPLVSMLESLLATPLQTPNESDASDNESRRSKRQRKQVNYEERSTRSPIPLGYGTLEVPQPASTVANAARDSDSPVIVDVKLAPRPADDNSDVSVVKLSAESAPAGLPAPGELQRQPLKVGDAVYAVRQSTIGSWALARLLEVWPPAPGGTSQFTQAKIRFEHKLKGASVRVLSGKEIAYLTAAPVRLTIGTRVIALFKDLTNTTKRESYYSGIIAEPPTPVNSYRYMVFFDDGYAQYVQHSALRVVYETSARVWEDVHPDSREFVQKYLVTYPERPMVRLSAGQALKSEWNGKWWISRVVCVDASLVQVLFESDGRVEWIYRGSTRLAPLYLELQAAERHRPRGLSRLNKPAPIKANMPYVEYTRSEEQDRSVDVDNTQTANAAQEESRRRDQQRSVAKKSTTPQVYAPQRPSGPQPLDNLMTRVVYYSPKAAVKPNKMVTHTCSVHCRRSDVIPLKELKTYNPLTRPLLTGWERQIMRCKGKKVVMYRSPCGRRIRDMSELHRYLRAIQSDCSVDLFDFNPMTHCLAEFVLNKCYVSKKDLSYGKENVPVPCVNYYDGSLPEYCVYNTERTPTAGVPLNLDPEFLCGCDCTDDCVDKSKCACWKLTLEGARTIGMEGTDIGYEYKRLPEPLLSGIYECNSRCKCAQTCLNRVAQHPLQLKLQVFKTFNRGWGIRALNDVPKGAFLCVYAGNLLTDATANLDGLNEGDEYLAELDYIEVVERLKEGYESDVAEERDKKKGSDSSKSDDDEEEDENERRQSETDADFRPDHITPTFKFTKRLRNRNQDKEKDKEKKDDGEGRKEGGDDDQFITISDDEEVREPSRFTAQAGLDDDDYVPRHRSVREVYGRDEACYIMDAKVQGNIGRYLNHSCTPNVFVQNVFVDTHDPRFPWVAFFALSHIQAGSELTWNYNYDIGSVPNKIMYCKCGAPNCRGRLL